MLPSGTTNRGTLVTTPLPHQANSTGPTAGEIRCPRQSCGAVNPAVNVFCYYCGALLRQPAGVHSPSDTQFSVSPARPRLRLSEDSEIHLTNETRWLGRDELSGVVPERDLKYISRQHLLIGLENGQYYVQDQNSTNGTKLNGIQIRGKGKYRLRHGDQIQLADVAIITFEVL